MPKITIDQHEVEVAPGATILEAARQLGIYIPTLCYLDGCKASTSCLVCMVRNVDTGRLVPSCATVAVEGMNIESETEEIFAVRKSALELLLSDHLGDCLAPCYFACPARMDIPTMLRQIKSGELGEAIATIKRDIALPAILGRICPAPCEKACRRRGADEAVTICGLKRFVADVDLAQPAPYIPAKQPSSGKRVGIVGAGPTGLSAAYYLLQQGHACTLFDENAQAGGRLRTQTTDETLPREVLETEIHQVITQGAELCLDIRVEDAAAMADLRNEFDAVLIAAGATGKDQASQWGLEIGPRGIQVARATYEASVTGTFAAGNAIRGTGMVVRSVADGKEAAVAIGQFLAGQNVTGPNSPFSTKIGRLSDDELAQFVTMSDGSPREEPSPRLPAGYEAAGAATQAARCLRCDCRALDTCKLRIESARHGANPRRYQTQRRRFEQDVHNHDVVFEPGKCIDCGLCVEIASLAGESLGLTFVGRGFDVRVGVPLGGSLDAALKNAAIECADACPTAALSRKDKNAS